MVTMLKRSSLVGEAQPAAPPRQPSAERHAGLSGRPKILIVEADRQARSSFRINFEVEGFEVLDAADVEIGARLASAHLPAIAVVDVALRGWGGLELCRRLLSDPETKDVPIVVLAAESSQDDGMLALELGARDLLAKPCSVRELVERVKAVFRRVHGHEPAVPHEVYEHGRLHIDFDSYRVLLDGRELTLSSGEFKLLSFFVRHPNRVFNRKQLLNLVWGTDREIQLRSVDVQVRRLRHRLETTSGNDGVLVTVRKVGYMFDERCLTSELEV